MSPVRHLDGPDGVAGALTAELGEEAAVAWDRDGCGEALFDPRENGGCNNKELYLRDPFLWGFPAVVCGGRLVAGWDRRHGRWLVRRLPRPYDWTAAGDVVNESVEAFEVRMAAAMGEP